jgi:heme A synthase
MDREITNNIRVEVGKKVLKFFIFGLFTIIIVGVIGIASILSNIELAVYLFVQLATSTLFAVLSYKDLFPKPQS